MEEYDPDTGPDAGAWLALSETERLALVVDYHEQAGEELPNAPLHAAIHAIIENQLAEHYAPAVAALDRLMGDGLGRHDAIHAIGAVLSELIWSHGRGQRPGGGDGADYEQALSALTAETWRERYGESP